MDRGAGVARDAAGLAGLLREIEALQAEHGPALELVTARLVAEAALARTHSRGAHFRADFPEAAMARHTMVTLTSAARPALMAAE